MAVRKKAAKKRAKRKPRKVGQGVGGGRPLQYQADKYPEMAMRHCLLGATDTQLADLFQITVKCIDKWKVKYPKFLEALRNGRENADAHVASSMYHRSLGYSCKEDKVFCNQGEVTIVPTIKNYPPDTPAAIFWLKNRHRDKWRDRQDIEVDTSESLKEAMTLARQRALEKG